MLCALARRACPRSAESLCPTRTPSSTVSSRVSWSARRAATELCANALMQRLTLCSVLLCFLLCSSRSGARLLVLVPNRVICELCLTSLLLFSRARAVISRVATARAASPSTERSSPTRTSDWCTRDPVCCPWRTLEREPTDRRYEAARKQMIRASLPSCSPIQLLTSLVCALCASLLVSSSSPPSPHLGWTASTWCSAA